MTDPPPHLPDFDPLWDYNHPDQSEARFRELLAAAEASGDRSYHAQLLSQIARAQGLQRRFDAAHVTLDTVQAMLRDASARTGVRYLLERGRVFNSSGQRETALPLFVMAWHEARAALEDGYAVDAAHMVAIAEASPERQFEWNMRALELAEQSPDERAQKWRGSLYNNIGWTCHEMARYRDALDMFEKALAWQEQHGSAENVRIARWSIAKTLRLLGRATEALVMQQALQRELERVATTDGYVLEELAECWLGVGESGKARPTFARAYAALSQDPWLVEHEADRLSRLKGLGGEC